MVLDEKVTAMRCAAQLCPTTLGITGHKHPRQQSPYLEQETLLNSIPYIMRKSPCLPFGNMLHNILTLLLVDFMPYLKGVVPHVASLAPCQVLV